MSWQALELRDGQEARIDIEGAEHGGTFIFSQHALTGAPALDFLTCVKPRWPTLHFQACVVDA